MLVSTAIGCAKDQPSQPDAGPDAGAVNALPVVISAAAPRPRTATWSVNYWTWPTSYGNPIAGTEAQVAALKPAMMRVGGYNNDANTPDPFNDAEFDRMIAYARAIGAEPIVQVPLLQDTGGAPPTGATAAAMVTYANVTHDYHVRYFSIGNEPDLYTAQGLPSNGMLPARPGYTPTDYCASARDYVTQMKAVDPTIQIVGPDLSYQYQANGSNWLTPILTECGDVFDIIAIHRYPFSAVQATMASATADVSAFRTVIGSVRGLMQAAGQGDKPLALTEMNIAYDATPA
ncbi:MAG TPA: glycosyl hydrolase, partial [Polyangiaceae bacterium]